MAAEAYCVKCKTKREIKDAQRTFVGIPHAGGQETSIVPCGRAACASESKSTITVKFGQESSAKSLELVRDWRLTPDAGGTSFAVAVRPGSADSMEIFRKPRLRRGIIASRPPGIGTNCR